MKRALVLFRKTRLGRRQNNAMKRAPIGRLRVPEWSHAPLRPSSGRGVNRDRCSRRRDRDPSLVGRLRRMNPDPVRFRVRSRSMRRGQLHSRMQSSGVHRKAGLHNTSCEAVPHILSRMLHLLTRNARGTLQLRLGRKSRNLNRTSRLIA